MTEDITIEAIFAENALSELLTAEKAEKLRALCTLLLDANERVNLTAVRSARGVYVRHFADSAKLVPHLPHGARVLDVGCGGGFPALVLAVLREDICVLGMDSTGKKLDFVRYAADSLGLNNLSVICGRAEEKAVYPLRESFDTVCARAVAPLPVLLELCLPYVKTGGTFAAMKTDGSELSACRGALASLGGGSPVEHPYTLYGESEELTRTIIIIDKVKSTPPAYPRKYARIKTKSL